MVGLGRVGAPTIHSANKLNSIRIFVSSLLASVVSSSEAMAVGVNSPFKPHTTAKIN